MVSILIWTPCKTWRAGPNYVSQRTRGRVPTWRFMAGWLDPGIHISRLHWELCSSCSHQFISQTDASHALSLSINTHSCITGRLHAIKGWLITVAGSSSFAFTAPGDCGFLGSLLHVWSGQVPAQTAGVLLHHLVKLKKQGGTKILLVIMSSYIFTKHPYGVISLFFKWFLSSLPHTLIWSVSPKVISTQLKTGGHCSVAWLECCRDASVAPASTKRMLSLSVTNKN